MFHGGEARLLCRDPVPTMHGTSKLGFQKMQGMAEIAVERIQVTTGAESGGGGMTHGVRFSERRGWQDIARV